MALAGLGVLYTAAILGPPLVTGVSQGVSHSRKQNQEAANETRMYKFFIDCFCDAKSPKQAEINGATIVVRNNKVWLAPKDPETLQPLPLKDGVTVPHPFTGFYIAYPDENRNPPQRGMVSTVSVDPPVLNWIYVDKDTFECKYGNRTQSIEHIVGEWDWTEDESGVTLEGWEGFVAVEEEETPEGLKWALYYDKSDDRLQKGKKVGGKTVLPCSLERRLMPEEQVKKDAEELEKKMQVKSSGGLKSRWN